MRNVEQVRAVLHAFKAVEYRKAVNPLRNFGEPGIAEAVLATRLDVFEVAVGNPVPVFDKDVHRLREQLVSREVFVHDDAETEVVHGVGEVLAHDGLLGRTVAGRELPAVLVDRLAELRLCVAEIADEDLVVVLVQRVLAQQQVLGLQVLVDDLVVVQLAYGVREVGELCHAVQHLVIREVRLESPVEGTSLDEFQLEVRVPARDAAAVALDHALDVRGAHQVVDADLVLECAEQHVQAVQPVLAGLRPELAYLHHDFALGVVAFVIRVLYPDVRTVQVVRAFERERLDEVDLLDGPVMQEFRVLVEPALVFLHAVMRAQREVARHAVKCFC